MGSDDDRLSPAKVSIYCAIAVVISLLCMLKVVDYSVKLELGVGIIIVLLFIPLVACGLFIGGVFSTFKGLKDKIDHVSDAPGALSFGGWAYQIFTIIIFSVLVLIFDSSDLSIFSIVLFVIVTLVPAVIVCNIGLLIICKTDWKLPLKLFVPAAVPWVCVILILIYGFLITKDVFPTIPGYGTGVFEKSGFMFTTFLAFVPWLIGFNATFLGLFTSLKSKF